MNKKHQIAYTKPSEPAFLTEFKKRAGFVEGDTIETKVNKSKFIPITILWNIKLLTFSAKRLSARIQTLILKVED